MNAGYRADTPAMVPDEYPRISIADSLVAVSLLGDYRNLSRLLDDAGRDLAANYRSAISSHYSADPETTWKGTKSASIIQIGNDKLHEAVPLRPGSLATKVLPVRQAGAMERVKWADLIRPGLWF